jgi:acyl transferase domain-containing protein/acyl carrier protein
MIDQKNDRNGDLAIVGIGCIFPKAPNKAAYWSNIKEGVDAITEVPATHWQASDYFNADPHAPDMTYAMRGGFIEPVDFDPLLYGMSPNNIEATDTTQLLGMVVAREALLDAGYATAADNDDGRPFDRDRTSVILGVTGTLELVIPLGARLGHPLWRQALKDAGVDEETTEDVVRRIAAGYVPWQENSFPGLLGNVAAGRIANRFDLGGTNCVVDAACASSLSAVHMAAMELYAGNCDMAITGGLDTFNSIFMYMCFSKTPALSPTGNSRPFHAEGDGTILGEGLGAIILKRRADAERDNDRIYAVIKGIGSSSDGKGNAIYAPSPAGQQKAMRRAYRNANLAPRTIELVEAHGTGTRVGDAVEAEALSGVYRDDNPAGTWCAIGSVKSMVGHTKAAAGVAGLIKVALALQHKVLPPTIKVDQPLDSLQPGTAPVYVNTQKRPWIHAPEHPRRAAVSAFGFGGSNFHAVLEEHDSVKQGIDWDGSVLLFAFSADDRDGIRQELKALEMHQPWQALRKAAALSLQGYEPHQSCRLILVMQRERTNPEQLVNNAMTMLDRREETWSTPEGAYFGCGSVPGKLAMLFPGQGSQYTGMLRDLACLFPQMLDILAAANRIEGAIEPGKRLSDRIYPIPVFTDAARAENDNALRATHTAQPALGAVSLGALRILESFGLRAEAVAGHSFGELTALCCANSLDEDAFLALAFKRGALMRKEGGDYGAMLAVIAAACDIYNIIEEHQLDLIVANHNAPSQVVLSGASDQIDKAAAIMQQSKLQAKRLPVAAAFHSSFVADAEKPLAEFLDTLAFRPPDIPVYANTTTQTYPADTGKARQLLAGQLARPVEFVKEIENMYEAGVRTFVEVGPANTLTGLVRTILEGRMHHAIALDAARGRQSGQHDLACLLARIAALGHPCDLQRWDAGCLDLIRTEKKPAMSVPISGANYVMPRKKAPPAMKQPPVPGRTSAVANEPRSSTGSCNTPLQAENMLQATTQTILALQQMQEQTAQLHRQYLQGVEQSQRTIQQLIAQQQQLVTGTPATSLPQPEPQLDAVDIVPSTTGTDGRLPGTTDPGQGTDDREQITAGHGPRTINTGQYENIVLEVVADKTGYPVEMLSLNMSLDTDLGIDSIKRVEILSALQEKVPGMRQIQPEELGTFQLLQHIVEFMGESGPAAALPSVPAPSAAADTALFRQTLLEVVAEKTGYPVDMLSLDMNLDADLGIDSIKRVEILSALQERLPHAPVVKPEDLGTLHTLGQIVNFMSAGTMPAAATNATPDDNGALQQVLLEVVAEKTGYPVEMLSLNMSLDTDLGIDSIKRVEILSALQERLPGAPAVSPDELGALQTLQQITEHLQGSSNTPVITAVATADDTVPMATETIYRSTLELVPVTGVRARLDLPARANVVITEDGTDLPEKICQALNKAGLNNQVVALHEAAQKASTVLLIPVPENAETAFIESAFALIQQVGKQVQLLACITRLGGAFGLEDLSAADPAGAGLAGIIKTADKEWPDTHCRHIDIPARRSSRKLAAAIAAELLLQGPLEAGIRDAGISTPVLKTAPVDLSLPAPNPFAPGDTVIITGGARGVTAETAITLATNCRTNLLLLGRTPLPQAEADWCRALTDQTALKQAYIARHDTEKLTPAEVDQACRKIMTDRELRNNLQRIQDTGVKFSYQAVDVRDVSGVAAVVDQARRELGPIRGVIHGAGVLADRFITDKTIEQFRQVWSTKVDGLGALLAATASDELKLMLMFSSTTARFGRKGQADYAAANEVLNKSAQHLQQQQPDCRVLSINWGPWDGGMVSPQLKQMFSSEGIAVIPIKAGTQYLLQEIGATGPVEIVVLGSELPQEVTRSASEPAAATGDPMQLSFERKLSINEYPVLKSHVMNGSAVLPAAIIAEWLAHGAMHNSPGLSFRGFNKLRILKGVILPASQTMDLQILAGTPVLKADEDFIPVELRCGDILHARAEIVLGTGYGRPQPGGGTLIQGHYPYQDGEYYHNGRLFHGPLLHGIEVIDACSAQGISGKVLAAPAPSEWMHQPIRSNWLADPLMLDAAFQMLILWSFDQTGNGSLPTTIGSYRQYSRALPRAGVQVIARILQHTLHSTTAMIEFLDDQGQTVARIDGYECVSDASLNDAFVRNRLEQQLQ